MWEEHGPGLTKVPDAAASAPLRVISLSSARAHISGTDSTCNMIEDC